MNPVSGAVMLIGGALGVALSLTVIWGLVGERTSFVQNARSRFAYNLVPSPYISRLRVLAYAPFFSTAVLAAGLSVILYPGQKVTDLTVLSLMSLALGLVAAIWPGPFLPGWMRHIEARRAAGLPPDVPPPPEGVVRRRLTRRDVVLIALILAGSISLGIATNTPSLVRAAVISFLFGVSYWR